MLVLIDESGETGFKTNSNRYFILTMIVFNEMAPNGRYTEAERTAEVIRKVMLETRHKPEFRFTKCSQKIRGSFFHALNEHSCRFEIYALIVDKTLISSDVLRKNSGKFYNFFLKRLLTHNPIDGASVKIDGQKNKEFQKALKSYLRQSRSGMVAKLKFCDSKKDVLIQLADMACGAIAHKYHQPHKMNPEIYSKILGNRIKNVWCFK
jgi:hypothetical protein